MYALRIQHPKYLTPIHITGVQEKMIIVREEFTLCII